MDVDLNEISGVDIVKDSFITRRLIHAKKLIVYGIP